MGITIFAKGKIDRIEDLPRLIDDLKEVAGKRSWKYHVIDLAVTDEGGYWESRDQRLLAEKRILLGHYLRHTEKVLSGIELSDEERKDPEIIADHIEEALLRAEEDGPDADVCGQR